MYYSSGMTKEDQITTTWSDFVRETIGDLPNKAAAERLGVSDSTVGNWVRGDHFSQPDARLVIRFARTFGQPLPEAMVAAGYGEENEYHETVLTMRAFTEMTADEIDEVLEEAVAEKRRRRLRLPRVNPDESPL